jgi:GNAT superfamily N-acetyltransferase
MKNINWDECALTSELEFSKALLSQPTEYPDFIHVHNPYVTWCGDFNRALRVKITDFQSFDRIKTQIEQIHREKRLDKPDRYDICTPPLIEKQWHDHLLQMGYDLLTAIFFNIPTKETELPVGYSLYSPSKTEYLDWYSELAKTQGYYAEEWFNQHLPLKENFIQSFKPYWLLKNKDMVGWVYSSNLGRYCRLFEVQIEKHFQGHGMGRLLLQAIINEGYRQGTEYILLQANDRSRSFYEKCGFVDCSRNSIIRLIQ